MTSWREGVSASTQGDVDGLIDAAVRIAQRHLLQASEFAPFALVVDLEGRMLAVDLDTSALGKHPESDELAVATAAQLRRLSESARCTALALNARLSQPRTDAIEVRVEHRDGPALLVFVPYKRPKFGGSAEYGDLMAYPGERDVWR